jgi:nicotinamide riboside kinase
MSPAVRIVLTGAESSGKSTLAAWLGNKLGVPYALEYARSYLEKHGPRYDYDTVHTIARGHLDYQRQQVPEVAPLGVYDTDLINFKIWCDVAYGRCQPWLEEALQAEQHHCYLLCYPDIPWEPDPLREYPEGRMMLYEKHLEAVQATGRKFAVVRGIGAEREHAAWTAVRCLLNR